mmetsp:Transcript_19164/g.47716  ORF Transcript_19164/g.47716 Transcript_19164/m.47716 type:complete len:242 (-) Transcript_19164:161-886(-)
MGYGRVDGVFCQIALDTRVVIVGSGIFRKSSSLALHLAGCLPGSGDDLTDTSHGLTVGTDNGNCSHIVQNILCGNGFRSNATLGKRHVLGNARIQVVTNHEHVKMLVHGVDGKWTCGVGRRWKYVGLLHNFNNIGSVSTACSFCVVGVDGSSLHGRNTVVDKATLVECVGVDGNRDIVLIGKAQTGVNRRWSCSPILVELETGSTCQETLLENASIGGISLSRKSKIHGNPVGRLEHHFKL